MRQHQNGSTPRAHALRRLQSAHAEVARLRRIRGAHRRTGRLIARAQRELALAALALALAAPSAHAGVVPPPRFFDPFHPYGLGPVPFDAAASFVDLDGDGDLDAFVAGGDAKAPLWFENTGTAFTPSFAPGIDEPFGLDPQWSSPFAFADLDADGDVDALFSIYGDFDFFQNTGTATAPLFAPAVRNPFGLSPLPGVPALADLDGDGDLDLLVATEYYGARFVENRGTKSVPAFVLAEQAPADLADLSDADPFVFGDLDADGDVDALVR